MSLFVTPRHTENLNSSLTHTLIFAEYNQQDATFLYLFISLRRSTCFRRFFRTQSGAQNCTYSVRYLSHRYCYLLPAWMGWNVSSRPQLHPDPARKLSANLYDIYHCCVYSETLLMMDRGTVRNMHSFIPKIKLRK